MTHAAAHLAVCQRTLRKARKAGRLRYVLIGRAIRYTLADLEQFVDSQRQQEGAPCPVPQPRPAARARTTRAAASAVGEYFYAHGASLLRGQALCGKLFSEKFPFCEDNYNERYLLDTQHLDPARIAWVEATLAANPVGDEP